MTGKVRFSPRKANGGSVACPSYGEVRSCLSASDAAQTSASTNLLLGWITFSRNAVTFIQERAELRQAMTLPIDGSKLRIGWAGLSAGDPYEQYYCRPTVRLGLDRGTACVH